MSGGIIVDPTTGEVLEGCPDCVELRAKVADLEELLAVAEVQRQRSGREARAAKRMLSESMQSSPLAASIREVLEYWAKDHPRSKIPHDGPRAQIVKKALGWGYSVDDCKKALDGLAAFPCVGPQGGRVAANVPGAKRYDDVQYALGSEARIEKCMSMSDPPPENVTAIRPTPRGPVGPAIDRVLPRLEDVKPAGLAQWLAKCPAHDDRHASLSVAQGEKGVVATCHAGCEPAAVADAIGVPLNEWFDTDPDSRPAPVRQTPGGLPNDRKIQAWHEALLAHDKLLGRLRVVKGWTPEGITVAQVGWDGRRLVFPIRDKDGALINLGLYLPKANPKMIGIRHRERGLFPAPETHRAGRVWLVEGEPDAVTLLSLGIPAVGLPGVNGWRTTWAERFAGREVVVCMDCDEPGRKAAGVVAQSLRGVADVRRVDLDPARTDGFDVGEFVAASGTRVELEAFVGTDELRAAA